MTVEAESREALGRLLGHRFSDSGLLDEALIHPSARGEAGTRTSYERLEFLGDRVLALIVAELLFRRFSDEPEGALARRFAALVSGESLAAIAASLDLGRHMVMAKSERRAGGSERPANLENLCEALIAALYLDGGLEAARRFITRHWAPLLDEPVVPPQDSKTALQEWTQGKGAGLPDYRVVDVSGPAHAPVFEIEVVVEGEPPIRAQGSSRRAAEQAAAAALLDQRGTRA